MSDSLVYIIMYVLPSLPLDYTLDESGTFPGSPWFPQCLCHAVYKISAYKHLWNQWMNEKLNKWMSQLTWRQWSREESGQGNEEIEPKVLVPYTGAVNSAKAPLTSLSLSFLISKMGTTEPSLCASPGCEWGIMQNPLVKCKALPTVGCFCCVQGELPSPAGM